MDPSSNTHGRTSIIPSVNIAPTTIRYRQFLLIIIQPKWVPLPKVWNSDPLALVGCTPTDWWPMDPSSNTHGRTSIIPSVNIAPTTIRYRQFLLIIIQIRMGKCTRYPSWQFGTQLLALQQIESRWIVQAIFYKIDVYYLVNGAPYSNLCYVRLYLPLARLEYMASYIQKHMSN